MSTTRTVGAIAADQDDVTIPSVAPGLATRIANESRIAGIRGSRVSGSMLADTSENRLLPSIAPIEDPQTSPDMSPNYADHIANQSRIANLRGHRASSSLPADASLNPLLPAIAPIEEPQTSLGMSPVLAAVTPQICDHRHVGVPRVGVAAKPNAGVVIHLPRPAQRLEAPELDVTISRLDVGRVSTKKVIGMLGWDARTELIAYITLDRKVVIRAFDIDNQHSSHMPIRLDGDYRLLLPPAVIGALRLSPGMNVLVVALPETQEMRIDNANLCVAGAHELLREPAAPVASATKSPTGPRPGWAARHA